MVELLGSLLAKYCTGQFWWLSFFVNRLLGSDQVTSPIKLGFGGKTAKTRVD